MRKRASLFVLIAMMGLLTACGDDVTIVIPQAENLSVPKETEQIGSEEKLNKDRDVANQYGEDHEVTDVSELWSHNEKVPSSENVNGTETEEISQVAEQEDNKMVTITISAAGDVTLGNYLGQDYEWSFDEMWEQVQTPDYFLENVYDIFADDDMTLVNLEGPLTTSEECKNGKTYCIGGSPEYAKILTAGSVEAVGMANNHSWDYMEQGLLDTVEAVSGEGIVYAYDEKVAVYETKGIRIGYISISLVERLGEEKLLKKGMEKLREQDVDLIIVTCHWGIEREFYPEERQTEFGHKCIDAGADLVIGHHPHVIQGIEEYQGKYIVYSLGNFCFGANRNPVDKDCYIFQQSFSFENGEKMPDTSARIVPCLISSVKNRNDYKPTPAEEDDKKRILRRMNEYCSPFSVWIDEDGSLRTD